MMKFAGYADDGGDRCVMLVDGVDVNEGRR